MCNFENKYLHCNELQGPSIYPKFWEIKLRLYQTTYNSYFSNTNKLAKNYIDKLKIITTNDNVLIFIDSLIMKWDKRMYN